MLSSSKAFSLIRRVPLLGRLRGAAGGRTPCAAAAAHCNLATTTASASSRRQRQHGANHQRSTRRASAAARAAALAAGATGVAAAASCEAESKSNNGTQRLNPATVGRENFAEVQQSHVPIEDMPEYTSDQLAADYNGEDGRPVYMSYGGVVYDVTNFIPNHPGGSEQIMKAAGGAIEPYWYLYRQHFSTDLPMRLMEHMAVGRLKEEDQDAIDEQMGALEQEDPYAKEPLRHRALIVHSDTPMNAEVPSRLLTQQYLTPASLFYIRHHHPVPFLTERQLHDYRLKVDLSELGVARDGKPVKFTLDDLKKMEKAEVTVTLQCSGNRRGGFNAFQRTSGTPWGQGAISTAKFGGVRLTDLLKAAGLDDPIKQADGMEHVRFHALDGMSASISIEKALNPYGDVIVAYEMNGEPLSRDHGFPLRVVVPGYAAVRNVKWVEKIELSKSEAEGPWQRGLNYKALPPNVTDASEVNLDRMPSMTEVAVFSGITKIERSSQERLNPGDRCAVKVSGWAWAGGGRNIVRVDVTGDDGGTWSTAELKEGSDQKFGRAWAWVFWECELPVVVGEDGAIHVASKAVDIAFNSQPEKCDHTWNVRGLGNNSWYRAHVRVLG